MNTYLPIPRAIENYASGSQVEKVALSKSFSEGKNDSYAEGLVFVLFCRPGFIVSFGFERIKAVAMMKEETNAVSPT